MGILPHSCLCIAGILTSISSKLQQALGKHELDGPLAHSDVLDEGHPHFLPPRAIKVHFLQCLGSPEPGPSRPTCPTAQSLGSLGQDGFCDMTVH